MAQLITLIQLSDNSTHRSVAAASRRQENVIEAEVGGFFACLPDRHTDRLLFIRDNVDLLRKAADLFEELIEIQKLEV